RLRRWSGWVVGWEEDLALKGPAGQLFPFCLLDGRQEGQNLLDQLVGYGVGRSPPRFRAAVACPLCSSVASQGRVDRLLLECSKFQRLDDLGVGKSAGAAHL